MSSQPNKILTTDGIPLEESLKKAEKKHKIKAFLLVDPLLLYLIISVILISYPNYLYSYYHQHNYNYWLCLSDLYILYSYDYNYDYSYDYGYAHYQLHSHFLVMNVELKIEYIATFIVNIDINDKWYRI